MRFFSKAISIIKQPFLFLKRKWKSIRIKSKLKSIEKLEVEHIEQELERVITALTSPEIETTPKKEIQLLQTEKKELLEKLTLLEIAEISKPKEEAQTKPKIDLAYLKQEIEPVNLKIREIKQKRKSISKINVKVEAHGFDDIFEKLRKRITGKVKTLDYSTNAEEKKLQRQIDELLKSAGLVTAFHIKEKRRQEEERIRKAELERKKREEEKKRKAEEAKRKKEQAEQRKQLEETLKRQREQEELALEESKLRKKRKRESLAESDTHYEMLIRTRPLHSFENVIAIASNQGEFVFESLGRGTAILQEQQQLEQYIFSFGRQHKMRLNSAFTSLFNNENVNHQDIHVIDWGCGQALATCVLLDFLKAENISPKFENLTLVEPSSIATMRGVLHLNKMLSTTQNPDVDVLNIDINSLTENSFSCSTEATKIHLCSNILDVEGLNLHHLFSIISSQCKGYNLFVCVSPIINEYRTNQLLKFADYFLSTFANSSLVCEPKTSDIPHPKGGKPYTRIEIIFKVFIP